MSWKMLIDAVFTPLSFILTLLTPQCGEAEAFPAAARMESHVNHGSGTLAIEQQGQFQFGRDRKLWSQSIALIE